MGVCGAWTCLPLCGIQFIFFTDPCRTELFPAPGDSEHPPRRGWELHRAARLGKCSGNLSHWTSMHFFIYLIPLLEESDSFLRFFYYYFRRKGYRKSPNENNIGPVSFLSEPGFGCHSITTTCHLSFFSYKCLSLFFRAEWSIIHPRFPVLLKTRDFRTPVLDILFRLLTSTGYFKCPFHSFNSADC
jgi:hypothetical protein